MEKYYYPSNPSTKEYTGKPCIAELCQLTGAPILPRDASWTDPTCGDHETAFLNSDGSWRKVPDYRQKEPYYDKETKQETFITESGIIPGKNLTLKKPKTPFDSFNDSTDDWVFDISLYRSTRIAEVSGMSFTLRNEIFPDYRVKNIIAGITYDPPYTLANYKATVEVFRTEFYRLKAHIEAASTKEAVDAIVAGAQWPVAIIEE